MTGLETADDGEIYFGDRMVQSLPPHERHVGMVFEDLGLWPGLTVLDNVGYPLKIQKLRTPDRRRRVARGLDGAADRQPGRPPSRSVDAPSAAADGPGAGPGDSARAPGPR